jgi:hypothetical protein
LDHFSGALLLGRFLDLRASLFVANSLVQYLPDQAAKFVGNYPNGLIMSQTRHTAVIENLEDASFEFGCSIGSLIQNPPHVTVALRRPAAAVHFRALFIAGACAYPRGEMLLGRKSRCGGTYFGDDLLCRVHPQAGHLRQSLDLILVRTEQIGHFLVELLNPLVD